MDRLEAKLAELREKIRDKKIVPVKPVWHRFRPAHYDRREVWDGGTKYQLYKVDRSGVPYEYAAKVEHQDED